MTGTRCMKSHAALRTRHYGTKFNLLERTIPRGLCKCAAAKITIAAVRAHSGVVKPRVYEHECRENERKGEKREKKWRRSIRGTVYMCANVYASGNN